MDFLLDPDGKCTTCAQPALLAEIITCCACSKDCHAVCSSTNDKTEGICNQTLLKLFKMGSTKSNFKWFCNTCLTNFETNKASTLDERFNVISTQIRDMAKGFEQVANLSKELNEMKTLINNREVTKDIVEQNNSWTDAKRVHTMKSSFVIKHKTKTDTGSTIDVNRIRQIAVENNIPVSNVGVSQKGNTFVHCPSVEHRDKLQPLISADVSNKDVVPIKEKSPHITITDITKTSSDDITKESVLKQIRNQNPQIAEHIDAGDEFNVLFIKSVVKTNSFSAVIRVSPNIRDTIKANRDRVYVGINSCRVFDRFYVKRCNNCHQFGHFKDKCQNETKCGYCSGPHDSDGCSLKDTHDYTKMKCANCEHNGLPHIGHSTFWHKCPSYLIAQRKLQSTISYYGKESNSDLNR